MNKIKYDIGDKVRIYKRPEKIYEIKEIKEITHYTKEGSKYKIEYYLVSTTMFYDNKWVKEQDIMSIVEYGKPEKHIKKAANKIIKELMIDANLKLRNFEEVRRLIEDNEDGFDGEGNG